EIAAELGVSKDTVARDLAAMRRGETADATDRTDSGSGSATDETRLTLPVSRRMADDLAVLAEAGLPPHEAVEAAVGVLSNTYRWAWLRGLTPRRVRPTIDRIVIKPHQGEQ
ncbi:MAG TPA: hypothetical protein VFY14_13815, partial [Streptomyces sp.]|nr:hypothetical protein [Streptomyces sp.]